MRKIHIKVTISASATVFVL